MVSYFYSSPGEGKKGVGLGRVGEAKRGGGLVYNHK